MELIGFAFAQIAMFVVGAFAGGLLAGVVWLTTRRAAYGRRKILTLAFLFPVLALSYLEAAWLSYGIVEYAMGRDSFVDGVYHYPLAGEYRLVIFDKMPEQAYIVTRARATFYTTMGGDCLISGASSRFISSMARSIG